MNVPKKDIEPATELDEDEEQSLPLADDSGRVELHLDEGENSLAAGRDAILHYLKVAPSRPGVYRMLDVRGDVLYVGKAKNIRKRVSAYARPTGLDTRIERMVAATRRLEFVVTRTETEALLLEANLIKRLRPRFNVTLRDDKSFPYILITSDHWAPQIIKHRGARSRSGHYYGPFASVWAVNRTINALQRAFLLRSCSDPFFENRSRPCLLYQIKRCSGPCTKEIDFPDYSALVREANAFLSGRSKAVKDQLAGEMEKASTATRLRTRRDLSRPACCAIGRAIASGRQSTRRRGGRCFCACISRAASRASRCFSFAPDRTGATAPIFRAPTARWVRAKSFGVPRAVLRRQAAAAADPYLACDRGSRAARGCALHQEQSQGRDVGAAARREERPDRACTRQRPRGAWPQACRNVVAAKVAARISLPPSGCRGRRGALRSTTTAISRARTRSAL